MTIWLERILGRVTCAGMGAEQARRIMDRTETRTKGLTGVCLKFENAFALEFSGRRTLSELSEIRHVERSCLDRLQPARHLRGNGVISERAIRIEAAVLIQVVSSLAAFVTAD
jgi:hypothetical protein